MLLSINQCQCRHQARKSRATTSLERHIKMLRRPREGHAGKNASRCPKMVRAIALLVVRCPRVLRADDNFDDVSLQTLWEGTRERGAVEAWRGRVCACSCIAFSKQALFPNGSRRHGTQRLVNMPNSVNMKNGVCRSKWCCNCDQNEKTNQFRNQRCLTNSVPNLTLTIQALPKPKETISILFVDEEL